ncbi:MAG: GIY-YIG nuclease family protein [Bacteroidota bacterium]|jgi:predicted GIY-YIG superfamily endonuclease
MDMKVAFKSFLRQNGFLPLSPRNRFWNKIRIVHTTVIQTGEQLKLARVNIKKELHGKCGLYVYLDKKGTLLYVGKANNLAGRVYSHYQEAFRGGGVWQAFFSKFTGELTVLWCEISTDRQRRAIEEMIEEVQRSEFDKFFPRRKRHLTSGSS